MLIELPNLAIDYDPARADAGVMLTQDLGGNQHMVCLHPCQVKLIAERLGLAAADGSAQRKIAALTRRLQTLRDRIDCLDDMLHTVADHGRECLDIESAYSFATWELANEFCADLDDDAPAAMPPLTGDTESDPSDNATASLAPSTQKGASDGPFA